MAYSEKLKDPRWQKKRLEILSRDEFTCKNCYDTKRTLHVHHRFYIKGNDPWDYPNHILITLCEVCHAQEEALKDEAKDTIYKSMLQLGLSNSDILQIATLSEAFPFVDFYPIHHDFLKFVLYSESVRAAIIEMYNIDRAEWHKNNPGPF